MLGREEGKRVSLSPTCHESAHVTQYDSLALLFSLGTQMVVAGEYLVHVPGI
jgi:hypothetical protein